MLFDEEENRIILETMMNILRIRWNWLRTWTTAGFLES